MTRPGPRKQPTQLRISRGNPSKRPLNLHEPRPDGVATCPTYLSPTAKREWRRLAPELKRLGLLTGLDQSSFAGYCVAYSDWRDLATAASVPGLRKSIYTARGEALRNLLRVGSEFGLSPSSRSGIVCPTKAAEDDLEMFIAGKPKATRGRPGIGDGEEYATER